MLRRSTITGIEIDPLTARIAKALYPDADIRAQAIRECQTRRWVLRPGDFQCAVRRLPVHDPRLNAYRFPIHDYFFAAALEKVRPGGLVMFITSRGTMDKLDSTLRELSGPEARSCLVRFVCRTTPSSRTPARRSRRTSSCSANCAPAKRPLARRGSEGGTSPMTIGERIPINEYFVDRPEMMLGHLRLTGRMYRDNEPTLGTGRQGSRRRARRKRFRSFRRASTRATGRSGRTDPGADHSRAGFRQTQRLLSSRWHGLHPRGKRPASAERFAVRDPLADSRHDSGA